MPRNYYPALRGIFGDWVYYSCLMSMQEVAERLSFASDIHKSEKLSEWIQRKLKGERSKEIASYLLKEKQRFFNALVVAIYHGDPAWHGFSNFKPLAQDIKLEDIPDEVEASVGFLSFAGGEKIFALDGQHRLAGMKEAIKENAELGKDEVCLVLVAHKNTKAGMERTRRLFTTLNKTARPVGKGEIIALDENDVMAIVTRHLVENDPRFEQSRIRFAQTDNLPAEATEWTTIGNVYDVLKVIFVNQTKGQRARDFQKIRPDDAALATYQDQADAFFTRLAGQFSELTRYFNASAARAPSVIARYRHRKGGHVLFRPVGLRLFAEVAAALAQTGLDSGQVFKRIGLLPVELSNAPYRGVLWLPNGNMRPNGRTICRRLLLYMLNLEKHTSDLRRRYAEVLGVDEDEIDLPERVV